MSDPWTESMRASRIYDQRNRWEMAVALMAVLIGLVIGFRYYSQQWILDADGLSVASRRLPYWDFSNLWTGGKFALDGHVAYLFDAETYRAALRAIFGPALPDQEWSLSALGPADWRAAGTAARFLGLCYLDSRQHRRASSFAENAASANCCLTRAAG